MPKGSALTPFTRHRSSSPSCSTDSVHRLSIRHTPSLVFPFRLHFDSSPKIQKEPILTLSLSSPSFLDATVTDDLTGHRLYTIETDGRTTTIFRKSSAQGPLAKAASVRWPNLNKRKGKTKSDFREILIRLGRSEWMGSEEFFVFGATFTTRKFMMQDYPDRLKWKHLGAHYHCITDAVKGPVAILEPATVSTPPRIKIYETLFKKDDRPKLDYRAIPIILLDHIVATAFLLMTDVTSWEKTVTSKKPVEITDELAPFAPPPPASPSSSGRHWRSRIRGNELLTSVSSERATSPAPSSFTGRVSVLFDSRQSQSSGSGSGDYAASIASAPVSTNTHYTYSDPRAQSFLDLMPTPEIPAPDSRPSSAAPSSHGPRSISLSESGSLLRQRRELPTPPVSFSHPRSDQPWLYQPPHSSAHSPPRASTSGSASSTYLPPRPSTSATPTHLPPRPSTSTSPTHLPPRPSTSTSPTHLSPRPSTSFSTSPTHLSPIASTSSATSPMSSRGSTSYSFEPWSMHSSTTAPSPQSANPPPQPRVQLQLHRSRSIASMRSGSERLEAQAPSSLPPKLANEHRRRKRPSTAPMRDSTSLADYARRLHSSTRPVLQPPPAFGYRDDPDALVALQNMELGLRENDTDNPECDSRLYELDPPPPAYDAIDFSLPRVPVTGSHPSEHHPSVHPPENPPREGR